MDQETAKVAAWQLTNANYGSFAHALGMAYIYADTTNRDKILSVFGDLFSRAYADKTAHDAFVAAQA